MSSAPVPFPPPPEGFVLHLSHCQNDPVASSLICQAYLTPLLAHLQSRFTRVDPDLVQTAAHDALVSYLKHPERYDPHHLDLGAYLRMHARGDLLNLLNSQRRHQDRRIPFSVVGDGIDDRYLQGREQDPLTMLEQQEEQERDQSILAALVADWTAAEKRVLDLMLLGERRTSTFAAALEIGDRTTAEQEREVKSVKDRLMKRLKRGVQAHD